ncbi:hypothetical protein MTO96_004090 [Rhipicephalus appendiculatus]
MALAAPAGKVAPAAEATAEEAEPVPNGDKAVEGLAGLHPAYGVRVSGSRIKRGRRIVLGSHGISYGNGVHGGTDRRDYGHVHTYGDRETFGFVRNPSANRRYGQGSYGNAYNNQAHGAGGSRYGVGY